MTARLGKCLEVEHGRFIRVHFTEGLAWNKPSGGRIANINRPVARPTHEKELPVGHHPLQLYSLGTLNGVKVTILLYLAEKFAAFLPTEPGPRAECLSWLFWQMGSAPYLGGGLGHFYAYAPAKIEYAIDGCAMEVKRQLDVLDRRLAEKEYIAGDIYTIADMAIFPWYGGLAKGWQYGAAESLSVQDHKNVQRWADMLLERPAVQCGRMVNRVSGEPSSQLHERRDAGDFETKTQDKLVPTS